MDADVVFPREFLRRLVATPAPSARPICRGFEDTGEEQKAYTRRDRVIALGKKVGPEAWEMVGEAVGFFKCGVEAGPELVRLMKGLIDEGQGLSEHEDAIHGLLASRHAGGGGGPGRPRPA